ncbi:MAG: GAF domain-containing protein [Myxococcota bacterium]|nr:GAF domain-containing protein [Myxococcota bacterium]
MILPSGLEDKRARYVEVRSRLEALLDPECDWVAAMATVACELHHAFDAFHWTGFYRVVSPGLLRVGPYQGDHVCLEISFDRGVCGAAARTRETQVVDDVTTFPGHIACSATTRSEIVVPICGEGGELLGVLDVDSDESAAFDEVDREALEALCADLGRRYARVSS